LEKSEKQPKNISKGLIDSLPGNPKIKKNTLKLGFQFLYSVDTNLLLRDLNNNFFLEKFIFQDDLNQPRPINLNSSCRLANANLKITIF